jgi:hypothetical protein
MPPLAAAIPAIAAGVSAASGAVGTGMAIDNASKAGSNPGTAPIDQSVGQMDPSAFGYGGGIQTPEQQALQGQHQQAQQANQQATQQLQRAQQQLQLAQQAASKPFWNRSPEERAAVEQLPKLAMQMPQLMQRAQAAGAAFKDVDTKMQSAPSLAQSEADRYRGLAGAADQRGDVQGRADMQGAVGLARTAAEGNAPSVAQMQLRQGMDQANAQAAGMAAGARGGGGNLALAARQAQMQQGQNAMATNQQNAMLRATEMAQARQQYMQGAQGLGQMDLASRQMNDARNQYYEGGLQRIYGAQQQGMSGYQQQQAQNRIGIEQGNRGLADKRFSDQQAGTSAALQMGGRAAEGLLRIPGALENAGSTSSPGSKSAYGGGTWVKQADGNYGYQNNG